VLVVGLGCPRQEKWISKYKDQLPVKISAGLGGSIDSIAGTVKRAPKVVQALGLEWLFRAILQPVRFKRLLKIPVFILKVMVER
jgi:N-acetylglucosaminyldiphosphoundecaprenol N-acetyl-beta-D-mannosaminyltransferase